MTKNICIAPTGQFRVVVVDTKEMKHSIVESDYTDIDSDHFALPDAQRRADEWDDNNSDETDCLAFIYNDKGEVCARK